MSGRNADSWNSFKTIGDEQGVYDKPLTIRDYVSIMTLGTVGGAVLGYVAVAAGFTGGLRVVALGMRLIPQATAGASKDQAGLYLALPGIIGGVIGFFVGLGWCFKMTCDERRQKMEQQAKAAKKAPTSFEDLY